MFLLNGSPLQIDVAFTYNGVKYPANWLRLASAEEKAAAGITEVADPVRYDDRFYWDAGLPKDLDDLKTEWNRRVDDMAYTMLLPSDWMVVRKQEVGTEIPADWATYRAAVRSAAAANKTALNAATDIDGFVSVATTMQWPVNPNATI
jgi:hypothetical protein